MIISADILTRVVNIIINSKIINHCDTYQSALLPNTSKACMSIYLKSEQKIRFSKYEQMHPIQTNNSLSIISYNLKVVPRNGILKRTTSDSGLQFSGQFVRDFGKAHEINWYYIKTIMGLWVDSIQ